MGEVFTEESSDAGSTPAVSISIFLQGVGSMKYNFMVSIIKDDDWYVASCLENHIASQGKTRDEALANLQEALELYYEDNDEIPNFEKPFVTSV